MTRGYLWTNGLLPTWAGLAIVVLEMSALLAMHKVTMVMTMVVVVTVAVITGQSPHSASGGEAFSGASCANTSAANASVLSIVPLCAAMQAGPNAWKTGPFRDAPDWMRASLRHNFRTPQGAFVASGLFLMPLWLWAGRCVAAQCVVGRKDAPGQGGAGTGRAGRGEGSLDGWHIESWVMITGVLLRRPQGAI